jgi:hypothetical protein
MDCATGIEVLQNGVSVPSGERTFSIPSGLGNEVVLEMERAQPSSAGPETLESASFGRIKSLYR